MKAPQKSVRVVLDVDPDEFRVHPGVEASIVLVPTPPFWIAHLLITGNGSEAKFSFRQNILHGKEELPNGIKMRLLAGDDDTAVFMASHSGMLLEAGACTDRLKGMIDYIGPEPPSEEMDESEQDALAADTMADDSTRTGLAMKP